MKKLFIIHILTALMLTGCQSVKTCNYTLSKSLFYVASKEKTTADFPAQNSLVVFATEDKNTVTLSFFDKSRPESKATAKIDKGSFSAFILPPGEYVFQKNTAFSAKPGEIIIFQCSAKETKKISAEEFKKKFSTKDLSEECSGTDCIIPANLKVPDLVGGGQKFGYYTGKTIGMVIISPFYVLYGTCFMIGLGAKAAMDSGSPPYMLGGALFYALTFWAIPDDVKESLAAEGKPYSSHTKKSGTSSKSENTTSTSNHSWSKNTMSTSNPFGSSSSVNTGTFAPGIYQDMYGRPVKYEVDNGVPGEQLQIKHNAYGPGIGMDQYGRPVRTVPAF